jgi:hypothetical protein
MLALEFAVIIVIALIGFGVVSMLFSRVEQSQGDVVQKKVSVSPPKTKKPPVLKKPTKKELKAQRELDEIVAADLARATSGMHADARISKITTLDEFRVSKKEKAEKKEPTKGGPKEFTTTQIAMDKEQGFTVVKKEEPRKKSASPAAAVSPSAKDSLDKKLANFFRNNETKRKKRDDEGPAKDGGRVAIKKDITTTRTW